MPTPAKTNNGQLADDAVRGLNFADLGAQASIAVERFRRLAQTGTVKGAKMAAANAKNLGKAYARKAGIIGLAIEAGNTAWLAASEDKRGRIEAEWEANTKKPAVERAFEGALSPTDTLFAVGKAGYDYGRTKEAIERGEMDAGNSALIRKIAAHEAELAKEREASNRQADIEDLEKTLSKDRTNTPQPISRRGRWWD